ncbi:hypothetical protein D3C87_1902020 [compost metagenome]
MLARDQALQRVPAQVEGLPVRVARKRLPLRCEAPVGLADEGGRELGGAFKGGIGRSHGGESFPYGAAWRARWIFYRHAAGGGKRFVNLYVTDRPKVASWGPDGL